MIQTCLGECQIHPSRLSAPSDLSRVSASGAQTLTNARPNMKGCVAMMTNELQELYETDKDFKRYVDERCRNHSMSPAEVFEFNILKEYAKYIKEAKK